LQWGFYGNVINARGEDLFDVLFEHRKASLSGLGRAKESNPAFGRATTLVGARLARESDLTAKFMLDVMTSSRASLAPTVNQLSGVRI
ncbi:MAG: hypothetical protein AAAB17_11655, partial [Pseudomonas sp.]